MAVRQTIKVAFVLLVLLVTGLASAAAGYAAGYLAGYDDGFGTRQLAEPPHGVSIDWTTPENQAQLRRAFPEANLLPPATE
jgi:hypothetical protein